jgi:hypothetical protein
MALMKLDPPAGYDLSPIQAMFLEAGSAAEIYRQIAPELEESMRSGQRIRRELVRQLVMKHGVFSKALPSKIDLIVEYISKKK